jgi:integral membrane sensor domain MASE1
MSELLTIFLFYKMGASYWWWVALACVFATEFVLAYRKYLRTYANSKK